MRGGVNAARFVNPPASHIAAARRASLISIDGDLNSCFLTVPLNPGKVTTAAADGIGASSFTPSRSFISFFAASLTDASTVLAALTISFKPSRASDGYVPAMCVSSCSEINATLCGNAGLYGVLAPAPSPSTLSELLKLFNDALAWWNNAHAAGVYPVLANTSALR